MISYKSVLSRGGNRAALLFISMISYKSVLSRDGNRAGQASSGSDSGSDRIGLG
jgi:hypothetical protein